MWRKRLARGKNEKVNYAEILETPENAAAVSEAKQKELQNFDRYEAFEEVEDEGQEVLGTKFVLMEKPDKSINARFVIKGFQENFDEASNSPTSSRETIRVFLAIAANKGWKLQGVPEKCLRSDVLTITFKPFIC